MTKDEVVVAVAEWIKTLHLPTSHKDDMLIAERLAEALEAALDELAPAWVRRSEARAAFVQALTEGA